MLAARPISVLFSFPTSEVPQSIAQRSFGETDKPELTPLSVSCLLPIVSCLPLAVSVYVWECRFLSSRLLLGISRFHEKTQVVQSQA